MEGKKRRLSSVAAKTSGAPRKRSKTGSDEEEGGLVIGHGHKRQTKVQRSDIIKPKGAAKTQNLEADHVEEDEVFLVETTPTTPHYDDDDAQSQNEFDSLKDSQNKSDQENDENGTQNEREKDQSVMRDEAVDENGIVGTQSEGDGGAGLYVFQCASCSAIVGDSLAMHAIDEELNTTTLRVAPGVTLESDLQFSNSGPDQGCTYYQIKCKNTKCGKTLGKYYYSTPKALVNLQELYTLDLPAIRGYVLGASTPVPLLLHGRFDQLIQDVTELKRLFIIMQEWRMEIEEFKADVQSRLAKMEEDIGALQQQ